MLTMRRVRGRTETKHDGASIGNTGQRRRSRSTSARSLALSVLGTCVALGAGATSAAAASRWTASTAQSFRTLAGESIASVSCASSTSCVAVGSYRKSSTTLAPLMLVKRARRWIVVHPPVPAGDPPGLVATLTSVSCAVSGSCTVAGYLGRPPAVGRSGTGVDNQGLVLEEDHDEWTAVNTPPPASDPSASVELQGVACTGPEDCVAVGDFVSGADPPSTGVRGRTGLIVTEASGVWTPLVAPSPPESTTLAGSTGAELSAVSCASPVMCTAVGTYLASESEQAGSILVSGPGGWTAASAPLPAGGDSVDSLNSLSCIDPQTCTAVGSFDADGGPRSLILTESNGRWSAMSGPHAALVNGIYGVACVTPGDCTAVGIELNARYAQLGILLKESSGRWRDAPAPSPIGASASVDSGFGTTLSSVSCPTSRVCVAVGTYAKSAGREWGVLLVDAPMS